MAALLLPMPLGGRAGRGGDMEEGMGEKRTRLEKRGQIRNRMVSMEDKRGWGRIGRIGMCCEMDT